MSEWGISNGYKSQENRKNTILMYQLIIFYSMGEERNETTILNITHITKKIITTTLMREITNSMKTLVLILLKTVLLIFLYQDMDMLSKSPIQEQVN